MYHHHDNQKKSLELFKIADNVDSPPLQTLKAKRLELAREKGVPPYVIFHDSTLLEIHNRRPQTLDEMGQISGIGQAKLQKYGDVFLQVFEEIG